MKIRGKNTEVLYVSLQTQASVCGNTRSRWRRSST